MTEIEEQIIAVIKATRAEHHACTAGYVANQLGVSKSWVISCCERMRAKGLVAWTSFPGSLRVVDESLPTATKKAAVTQP
jgi:DNA-binding IclR family transcriptional regulator